MLPLPLDLNTPRVFECLMFWLMYPFLPWHSLSIKIIPLDQLMYQYSQSWFDSQTYYLISFVIATITFFPVFDEINNTTSIGSPIALSQHLTFYSLEQIHMVKAVSTNVMATSIWWFLLLSLSLLFLLMTHIPCVIHGRFTKQLYPSHDAMLFITLQPSFWHTNQTNHLCYWQRLSIVIKNVLMTWEYICFYNNHLTAWDYILHILQQSYHENPKHQ